MGWLFGKKKPKVPLPQGHPVDEKTLRFPSVPPTDKVITPDRVKSAVGVDKLPLPPPALEKASKSKEPKHEPEFSMPPPPVPPRLNQAPTLPKSTERKSRGPSVVRPSMPKPRPFMNEPLFVKVDVYQRILGELEDLRKNSSELSEANKKLETSEFNEEKKFDELKKSMKHLHDKLLEMDKTLFKTHEEL